MMQLWWQQYTLREVAKRMEVVAKQAQLRCGCSAA
jgi:hypothetical protein